MTAYGAKSRQPLYIGERRVEYGSVRYLKNGSAVYEFTPPRVKGQPKPSPQKLDASTATDAKHEIERLLPLTRSGKIGDRSVRLQATYEDALAAMTSGEFRHSQGRYSTRSIELFRQRSEDHVLRLLGPGMKIVDIRAAHLRQMMKRLGSEGLGGSTVRGCLSAASVILRYAVEQEVMEGNVANLIGLGERPSAVRRSEPRYLSVPEIELLLSKVTDETSRAVVASMFWGALRVSEALELRWSDIQGEQLLVRGTKTKGSWAYIPLLPQLAAVLRAQRERSAKLGFDRIQPDALVFQTRTGTALGRRNVLRSVQAAGDAAGLNKDEKGEALKDENGEALAPIGCHDLRHSMAANALSFLSMVETAKLLRHANPQVTATVYADLTQAGVSELAAKLTAGFGG